jgi:hypothetical protein
VYRRDYLYDPGEPPDARRERRFRRSLPFPRRSKPRYVSVFLLLSHWPLVLQRAGWSAGALLRAFRVRQALRWKPQLMPVAAFMGSSKERQATFRQERGRVYTERLGTLIYGE